MTSGDAFTIVSDSLERTSDIGAAIGAVLRGGELIAMVGELGSGKTHLVKAIAAGLAVADESVVTSPTFTLVQEYAARLHIFHLDAYRLEGPADFLRLGFDEMVTAGSVVLVEWADRVRAAIPGDAIWICLRRVNETAREFEFTYCGEAQPGGWTDLQDALTAFGDD